MAEFNRGLIRPRWDYVKREAKFGIREASSVDRELRLKLDFASHPCRTTTILKLIPASATIPTGESDVDSFLASLSTSIFDNIFSTADGQIVVLSDLTAS